MLALLVLLAAGLGGSPGEQGAEPAVAAAPSPKPAPRLRLGTFGLAALRPEPLPAASFEIPRFDTHIVVEGWARRDPNETMSLFVRNWKLDSSIYGRGISMQDTKGGGFNVLPLVDWGWKKWKDGKKNKQPPADLEEAPASPEP